MRYQWSCKLYMQEDKSVWKVPDTRHRQQIQEWKQQRPAMQPETSPLQFQQAEWWKMPQSPSGQQCWCPLRFDQLKPANSKSMCYRLSVLQENRLNLWNLILWRWLALFKMRPLGVESKKDIGALNMDICILLNNKVAVLYATVARSSDLTRTHTELPRAKAT